MKKFFKKLVGKDTSDSTQASAAEASQNSRQPEESKKAEQAQPQAVRPCADGVHRQANFKCWNDHCQAILCFACARQPNDQNQILCDLCHMSHANLGGNASDSSDDFAFDNGRGMEQTAHVTIDPHSSKVVGWDKIFAIIEAEDKERKDLEAKMDEAVGKYLDGRVVKEPEPVDNGNPSILEIEKGDP